MTNEERIKKALVNTIYEMGMKQLHAFICTSQDYKLFELNEDLYSCDMCRKFYGDCGDIDPTDNICLERFEDYCNKNA